MARRSLAAAKAEVFGFLHTSGTTSTVAGVTAIFDHHPPRAAMRKPITVTVTPVLVDADFWTFAVRVYAFIGGDADAGGVESTLEAVVEGIDGLLDAHWGPSDWKIDPHPSLEETVLAEWLVQSGREDGA